MLQLKGFLCVFALVHCEHGANFSFKETKSNMFTITARLIVVRVYFRQIISLVKSAQHLWAKPQSKGSRNVRNCCFFSPLFWPKRTEILVILLDNQQ